MNILLILAISVVLLLLKKNKELIYFGIIALIIILIKNFVFGVDFSVPGKQIGLDFIGSLATSSIISLVLSIIAIVYGGLRLLKRDSNRGRIRQSSKKDQKIVFKTLPLLGKIIFSLAIFAIVVVAFFFLAFFVSVIAYI